MSTLHHADLLESIYEGLLYELQEAGHYITNPNAQYVAEVRADENLPEPNKQDLINYFATKLEGECDELGRK